MGEGLPAGAGVGGRGAKKPLLRSESTEDVQRAYPPPRAPGLLLILMLMFFGGKPSRDQGSLVMQSASKELCLQGRRAGQRTGA